jgi:hypothetical protein
LVALPQVIAYFTSSANDAIASVESGLQGGMLAQEANYNSLAIFLMGITACFMIGAGRLHEAYQLTHRAILLGSNLEGCMLPDAGWPAALKADILREWNQPDLALSLVQEAISLCQQTESSALFSSLLSGRTRCLPLSSRRAEHTHKQKNEHRPQPSPSP